MRPFFNPRLAALLILFAGLCLAYNAAVPLFEAPDEYDHVNYAHWLANGNGLPHLVSDRDAVGEIWQPPLYYALMAAVIAPFDRAGLDAIAPLSGDWLAGLSRVAHYHTASESFPWRGPALAVHVARAVSTVLGAITVLVTYAIGRGLLPRHALLAAALVALNPQFIFMSAAVNNDNLVIALSSVALWLVVKLVTGETDASSRLGWGWYAALGVVWGTAALAKLTGLTLGLVIGLALLYIAARRRSLRPFVVGGLLTGGGLVLVCGWWFWRNWQLYGDPLAWDEMLAVTGSLVRPSLLGWPATLQYATFLRQTYWASFGYGVLAPDSFYGMSTAVMLLAAVGWALRLLRRRGAIGPERVALLLLAVWFATVLAFLLRWIRLIDMTNQGRLLFPAIAALGVLGAAGLAALEGRRMLVSKAVAAVLGCWAAALPLLIILPAYAQPSPVEIMSIPNRVDIHFGDAIRLRGYELPAVVAPGEPVAVSLYWEAAQPIAESYVVALRVLDPTGQPATGLDTLPAGGRYSTAVWSPGESFRDSYTLPPVSEMAQPGLGTLLVILYPRGEPDAPLVVSDGADAPLGREARIGAIRLAPPAVAPVTPPKATGATLGGRFHLQGYDAPATPQAGETMDITLYWEALAPDGRDYTVFVHLVDAAGQLVAQSDGPPRGGTYPTSIWNTGEQIIDTRAVALPAELTAGRYTLLVGLYDPANGARLPAVGADGVRYVDDAVRVVDIVVAARPPD